MSAKRRTYLLGRTFAQRVREMVIGPIYYMSAEQARDVYAVAGRNGMAVTAPIDAEESQICEETVHAVRRIS